MLGCVAMTSELVEGVVDRMVVWGCCGRVVVSCSGEWEWEAAFCRVMMLSR